MYVNKLHFTVVLSETFIYLEVTNLTNDHGVFTSPITTSTIRSTYYKLQLSPAFALL